MTEPKALEILKRHTRCRTADDCPDYMANTTSCYRCEYDTDFDELTQAMETAIAIMEGRVKE